MYFVMTLVCIVYVRLNENTDIHVPLILVTVYKMYMIVIKHSSLPVSCKGNQ